MATGGGGAASLPTPKMAPSRLAQWRLARLPSQPSDWLPVSKMAA